LRGAEAATDLKNSAAARFQRSAFDPWLHPEAKKFFFTALQLFQPVHAFINEDNNPDRSARMLGRKQRRRSRTKNKESQ